LAKSDPVPSLEELRERERKLEAQLNRAEPAFSPCVAEEVPADRARVRAGSDRTRGMMRICLHPNCPDAATPGKSICAAHAAKQRKANRSVSDSFYSSVAWRRTREKQLHDHPLCQYDESGDECEEIADSVHHIVPIEIGGARRDPANLMSVCRRHHSTIHAQRRGRLIAT
jgi:5-methylcytosine-specific restriction endonuclease McrA